MKIKTIYNIDISNGPCLQSEARSEDFRQTVEISKVLNYMASLSRSRTQRCLFCGSQDRSQRKTRRLQAQNSHKPWLSMKTSPRSSTLHALYTYLNVICVLQIMSGSLPDTYINA